MSTWDNEKLANLEAQLWDSADELRANSKLTSGEYFFPVMGVIFLRHAQNRFDMATRQIEEDQAAGKMPKRPAIKADYIKRRSLWLPENARYDYLLNLPTDEDLGTKLVEAMNAIEEDFEPLKGQLPKEYTIFESDVLEELLKNFNHEALKTATGDVFGRIYEYFLMKFSMQKAYDNGEFFTPPSIVQTIVNVIEPDHGIVFDPATGSGGMFVQTSHFVENQGQDTTHAVTFYGQEKTKGTIPLAKMNLAVHALEGAIQEANTFYEDVHTLFGKCDFVMANPPFNVDKVDAKRVKGDVRLPFGLPGVNKQNRVSNGNYLWISYFHSYLNQKGRAGFVMSSQASSAGHGERDVRRRIIETGTVDVMVAIRSNFFYTRSVPCELWFFDKGKPSPSQPSPPAPLPEDEGRTKKDHYRGAHDFSGLVRRARELRQKQTPAEEMFWELVRDRRFLDLKFRRQHQIGDYILDFYCHEVKTAIELDGPVHRSQQKKDAKRDKYLLSQGVQTIRIRNEDLLQSTDSTLDRIASKIPLPRGDGRGEGSPLPMGEDLGEGISCKAPLNRSGNVLMVDARHICRKVTRKIYDFSPEQLQNIAAVVWLYRGQTDRFLQLVRQYLDRAAQESAKVGNAMDTFKKACLELVDETKAFIKAQPKDSPITEPGKELNDAFNGLHGDSGKLIDRIARFKDDWGVKMPTQNKDQHDAGADLEPIAQECRDLVKQIDLVYKLASRVVDALKQAPSPQPSPSGRGGKNPLGDLLNMRDVGKKLKALDACRKESVEQLKQVAYFHKQVHWLQSRFPDAAFANVEGLCKLVAQKEIEANDWSLTPGRYVGVAPQEEDEDFDFEETLREIHVELADLNKEATNLAKQIQTTFEELGV